MVNPNSDVYNCKVGCWVESSMLTNGVEFDTKFLVDTKHHDKQSNAVSVTFKIP